MFPELLYRMALTQVPQIGDVQARVLLQHFGSATAVFAAPARDLERIEGIGTVRAKAIRQFDRFRQLEPELRFLEKHQLHSWFLIDNNYPRRLQHCYDPPVLLFGKGEMDLDAPRLVAIVGTRSPGIRAPVDGAARARPGTLQGHHRQRPSHWHRCLRPPGGT